ncbi:MAG: hypothetical protein PVG53_09820 [Holophagae bacterium]
MTTDPLSSRPRRCRPVCHDAARRVRRRGRSLSLLVAVMVSLASAVGADEGPRPAGDRVTLGTLEDSPDATSESTIVEIPVGINLKRPDDGGIGYRLRLSVFFAWNKVRFQDISGGDLEASLRTLTVVPGIELVVPVGDRWSVRPYGQIGGLDALGMPGHRWLASLGSRANTHWDFERWILSAGGRFEYTTVLDEDYHRTDDVAFLDLGADFSFPLWFDVAGGRAAAGFFVIPRHYVNRAELVGQGGFDLGVDSHLELGASFQLPVRPTVWFVKLPSWYGVGVRLARGHRSFRVYLGFPF